MQTLCTIRYLPGTLIDLFFIVHRKMLEGMLNSFGGDQVRPLPSWILPLQNGIYLQENADNTVMPSVDILAIAYYVGFGFSSMFTT